MSPTPLVGGQPPPFTLNPSAATAGHPRNPPDTRPPDRPPTASLRQQVPECGMVFPVGTARDRQEGD
ncbi:hypothetical protein GCM10009734_86830 [Nonomuraea bangladeshensis]